MTVMMTREIIGAYRGGAGGSQPYVSKNDYCGDGLLHRLGEPMSSPCIVEISQKMAWANLLFF